MRRLLNAVLEIPLCILGTLAFLILLVRALKSRALCDPLPGMYTARLTAHCDADASRPIRERSGERLPQRDAVA